MHEFADSALQTLTEALARSSKPPALVIHRGPAGDPLSEDLAAVAYGLREGTDGAIEVLDGGGDGPPATPALTIAQDGKARIHYLSVPERLEALPFLDALFSLAHGGVSSTRGRTLLRSVGTACELLVFVTPGCPNCPHAARAATTLAAASPWITTSIIDATRFPELAERFSVRSVPLTVIDRGLSATGVVQLRRLAKLITSRGGDEHEAATFESMVKSGRFEDAAGMLIDGRGLGHFARLWRTSTLETRMGLMLSAEKALEDGSRALEELAPMLLASLDSGDVASRGDSAEILGKIGSPCARDGLQRMAQDPDPDLREAAVEALAGMTDLSSQTPG